MTRADQDRVVQIGQSLFGLGSKLPGSMTMAELHKLVQASSEHAPDYKALDPRVVLFLGGLMAVSEVVADPDIASTPEPNFREQFTGAVGRFGRLNAANPVTVDDVRRFTDASALSQIGEFSLELAQVVLGIVERAPAAPEQ